MTVPQANEILNRIRAGDTTPTQTQINAALILSGDITTTVSAQCIRNLLESLAEKTVLSRFNQVLNALAVSESSRMVAIEANYKRVALVQQATWFSALVRNHE